MESPDSPDSPDSPLGEIIETANNNNNNESDDNGNGSGNETITANEVIDDNKRQHDDSDGSIHKTNGDIMDTDSDLAKDNEDNCLVRLLFRDSAAFDEYSALIAKCIRDTLFVVKKSANVIADKSQNSIQICEISVLQDHDSIFMVDTLPTENADEGEIPNYNSSAIDLLNDVTKDGDAMAEDDGGSGRSKGGGLGNCWNCGGNHNMKDCKEKRDPAAISRAKQQFAQKGKVERYHADNEQKYSHLAPGKISDNLRDALGLRKRELPLYIYKMRLYGYPEGWLEEAKINHSGLTMIHSENKSITDKDIEDGEVDKVTFDASKFIEYPGFNAAVPSNLDDEGDFYQVPPMQFENTKMGLTQLLQNNLANPYKRKRLQLEDDVAQPEPQTSLKNDDMDLQDSDEGGTERPPIVFAKPKPDSDSDETAVPEDVSLLELKQKQEELLRALQDESCDSNSNSNGNSGSNSNSMPSQDNESSADKEIGEIEMKSNETNDENAIESPTLDTTVEMANETLTVPTTPSQSSPSVGGKSKMSVFGTPLIKQVSPFSKIPDGDKWSVGVTEVIDFENLPDATGAYEKLTGVIKKVRIVTKRINEENERDPS